MYLFLSINLIQKDTRPFWKLHNEPKTINSKAKIKNSTFGPIIQLDRLDLWMLCTQKMA